MRFMIILKSAPATEEGLMPSEAQLAAMGAFNQELVDAGVLLAGEGLHPSARGARVRFAPGAAPAVVDGPFPDAQELVAGFWIFRVDARQEAIDWITRMPHDPEATTEVEIRQVFEAEDFGDAFTPELREQEDRMREQEERMRGTIEEGRGG
jgi:hypothetical protein